MEEVLKEAGLGEVVYIAVVVVDYTVVVVVEEEDAYSADLVEDLVCRYFAVKLVAVALFHDRCSHL